MKEKEFFAALEYAGKFTWRRSRRKQSHYIVRREGKQESYTLCVGHDGEVKAHWVRKSLRHFGLE